MKKVTEVKVEIIQEDEEGNAYMTDLSAPTLEMVVEKIGAFERNL